MPTSYPTIRLNTAYEGSLYSCVFLASSFTCSDMPSPNLLPFAPTSISEVSSYTFWTYWMTATSWTIMSLSEKKVRCGHIGWPQHCGQFYFNLEFVAWLGTSWKLNTCPQGVEIQSFQSFFWRNHFDTKLFKTGGRPFRLCLVAWTLFGCVNHGGRQDQLGQSICNQVYQLQSAMFAVSVSRLSPTTN